MASSQAVALQTSPLVPNENPEFGKVFESALISDITDVDYYPHIRDRVYLSSPSMGLLSYDVNSGEEVLRFTTSSSIYKSTIKSAYGDLYYIEEGGSQILLISNYLDLYGDGEEETDTGYVDHTHTHTISDLNINPVTEFLYFSTVGEVSGKGRIYEISEGWVWDGYRYIWQRDINLFLEFSLSEVGSSWSGSFTFDQYGYLYINQGNNNGKVFMYDDDMLIFAEIHGFDNDFSASSMTFGPDNYILFSGGSNEIYQFKSVAQKGTDFTHDTSLDIAFVFVGYDAALVNTSEITSKIPHEGRINLGGRANTVFDYQAKYSFHFANETYTQQVNDFVIANSNSEPTVQINESALSKQATEWDPQDIFIPKNGTSIDGNALELWLMANNYVPEADYRFYVLNFTEFDTATDDHWFVIEDKDAETGIERHWYRNEFDFPWNFDAKFPYPAYTGHENSDVFMDPYAFQWYLNWVHIWNSVEIHDGDHDFYDEDFDTFLQGWDLTTNPGIMAFNDYLSDYIAEMVPMNLFWSPLGSVDYSDDLSIQITVFNGVSDIGYSNDDLQWIIDQQNVIEAYQELLPGSTINLAVNFEYLAEYSGIQDALAAAVIDYSPDEPPIENYTYYDGYSVFYSLHDESIANAFFDFDAAESVVSGYILVMDNSSFANPGMWAGGGMYTGLGGGGKILQLMELDRLYYPDKVTERQGFGKVVVHEAGHAIGMPHTFGTNAMASDFTSDTMGYYGGFSRFSKIRIEGFQRYAAEIEIDQAKYMLQEHMFDTAKAPWLLERQSDWETIRSAYDNKDFVLARQSAIALQELVEAGFPVIKPPSAPKLINKPADISFVEGESSVFITWAAEDDDPANYTIYQDSEEVDTGSWVSGTAVSYDISTLVPGTYTFSITFRDMTGLSVSDEALVTVLAKTSSNTTETTTNTTSNSSETPSFTISYPAGLEMIAAIPVFTYIIHLRRRSRIRSKNIS